MQTPLIIGHRGACGYLPEHTLESYARAVELGADLIETDVVLSRDGHLICRHDRELSRSTDVARHPRFASRRTRKKVDGTEHPGWFIEDFTMQELRALRACQPVKSRDLSFDGRYAIPTLNEVLQFAAGKNTRRGGKLGVVIEIKHASDFQSLGLSMHKAIREVLAEFSYLKPDPPVWVESFEIDVLKRLRPGIGTPIIQLLDGPGNQPPDVAAPVERCALAIWSRPPAWLKYQLMPSLSGRRNGSSCRKNQLTMD